MKNKSIPSLILSAIIALLIWLLFMVIIPGCSKQMHKSNTSVSYDSNYVKSLQHDVETLMEERSRLESQLHESEYGMFLFDSSRCPQITIPVNCDNDSIKGLVNQLNDAIDGLNNKIKVYKDGTIEASGKLTSYKFSKDVQQNIISSQDKKISQLEHDLEESKAHVKVEIKTVEKTVVKKTMAGIVKWLLLLAFILGCVFWDKLGKKVKNIFRSFFKR